MTVIAMNKETNEEIIYNNVIGYDVHGDDFEPVFQLILPDGTATFHKKDWNLFLLKRV